MWEKLELLEMDTRERAVGGESEVNSAFGHRQMPGHHGSAKVTASGRGLQISINPKV